MCTVTWSVSRDGYDLFMNRDELHSRARAQPVGHHEAGPVPYLSPVDPEGGGSWIATNACGLTACLLNNYPAGSRVSGRPIAREEMQRGAAFTSRGLLIVSLMTARSVEELHHRIMELDLSNYRPFFVLAAGVEPGPEVSSLRLFRWDGSGDLVVDRDPAAPVSTSSFQTDAAVGNRREVYRRLFGAGTPGPAGLTGYHRSHDPEPGAYSVCVHRDDAATKSFSHVSVRPDGVTFEYTDGPPCEDGPVTVARLARHEI